MLSFRQLCSRWFRTLREDSELYDLSLGDYVRKKGASETACRLLNNSYFGYWGSGIEDVATGLIARHRRQRAGTTSRFANGSGSLTSELRRRLKSKIRLKAKASAIQRGEDDVSVRIESADGTEWLKADHVICALPLGVLKFLDIQPSIDAQKYSYFQDPPVTSAMKLMFSVDGHASFQPMRLFTDTALGLVSTDPSTQGGYIESFSANNKAASLARLTDERLARDAREPLEIAFSKSLSKVRLKSRFDWNSNPFFRGAYSYFQPHHNEMAQILARPVGRLHFAGEHTSQHPGWMEGALRSGIRAAYEVISNGLFEQSTQCRC